MRRGRIQTSGPLHLRRFGPPETAMQRTILDIPPCLSCDTPTRFRLDYSFIPPTVVLTHMAPPPPPPPACAAVAAMVVDKENQQQRPLQRRISMSTQQRQPLQSRSDNRMSLAAHNTTAAAAAGLKDKPRQSPHQAKHTLEEKSAADLLCAPLLSLTAP